MFRVRILSGQDRWCWGEKGLTNGATNGQFSRPLDTGLDWPASRPQTLAETDRLLHPHTPLLNTGVPCAGVGIGSADSSRRSCMCLRAGAASTASVMFNVLLLRGRIWSSWRCRRNERDLRYIHDAYRLDTSRQRNRVDNLTSMNRKKSAQRQS
ncbi:hypothetical protein BCR34DRAFT_70656 [Clohesyomyces aquaticus]|uniref:Uncharacterized protein n=1 Tax=Clohesyomyces aquaticus TaxID=1231657 RepID=A0A1Y1YZE5_9PLEO|nr:hypothetical protein BCR34DRAFT_70656 [Clohesyomyces aquaticus]